MAERRKCEQSNPRQVAERTCDPRRLDSDLRKIIGIRHFRYRGIGDEHGAPARQNERNAHDTVARHRIDAAPHVFERDGKIAGDSGDHGIGIAKRDHTGGEVIAVLVHQALAVTLQKAVTLQPLIEIGRIGGVARGHGGVDDLDAAAELDAERLRRLAHARLAADQQRRAKPLVHERCRRADHLLLFALGKDDAPRPRAQPFVYALQHAGDRIESAAQLVPIGVHVGDAFPGDICIHRRLGHRGGNV